MIFDMTIPQPTKAELEILQVLWERGEATVREVHQALQEQRETGYTTVLKLMQIMTEKGLLERDESQRAHVYRARHRQGDTQKQLLGQLMDKAFGGSAALLVQQALETRKTTPREIREIRAILDRYEQGGKK